MQAELIGGPKDGYVLGVPEADRQLIVIPYMTDPVYVSWTAAKELTAQEVALNAHEYKRIKGLSEKGYTRFQYVKGT